MQQVQLYIQGQIVDLFNDESINITQSLQKVKDPAKIFTEFSKSFTLPASKINNKIFKHYYNFNITNGFDARKKVSAEIQLNYVSFKIGYIKLEGVDLKNNKPNVYRVTFFGSTVELKDLLGEDKLGALTWLDNFNVEYSSTSIQTGLTSGYNKTVDSVLYEDAVIVPLITHTTKLHYDSASGHQDEIGNLYYHTGGGSSHTHGVLWSELKYSLRLHTIIKAIEKTYGITFSTDFFNTSNSVYHDLYMWMHRVKGNVTSSLGGDFLFSKLISFNAFDIDGYSKVYSSPVGEKIFTVDISSYDDLDATITFNTASTVPYNVYLKRNGVTVLEQKNKVGNFTMYYYNFANGDYTLMVEAKEAITFSSAPQIDFILYTGGFIFNETVLTFDYNIDAFFTFYPTQQLPEIKIIDFLTGLFKMFNLTAYVEGGVIQVKTLDTFYTTYNTYDITEYVDTSTLTVDVALPFKQINFKYNDYNTYLASVFNQLNNQQFGELEYKGSEALNWVGNDYNIVIPFQKIIYERLTDINDGSYTTIQVGYMLDNKQEAFIGKPLLHYANLQTGGTNISFMPTDSSNTSLSSYFIPLNQNGIAEGEKSLNFKSEIDEYTLEENTNTLFTYYVNYISDVFDDRKRLFKLKAYLPLKIFLKLKLNDTLIVNGKSFKINSLDTNLQTGESKLELLNDLT